jgi:hypothetical protein
MPESVSKSTYTNPPAVLGVVPVEPEVNIGRRAFPVTQELFAGSPLGEAQTLECGWYDTSVNIESGAFALVQTGAGLDDLIGEIVQVTNGALSVFVYVLQAAAIPTPFGLARRAWMAIALPSSESIECQVVPVE